MADDLVSILAGGMRWTAFRRCVVEAKFTHAARGFHIDIAAEPGAIATAWMFRAGTPVEIYFGGDLVLRGYTDRYQPRISGHDQAEIAVAGRSKSQDFIDSSAEHATGDWKNKTPAEIAKELDKFGCGVTTDQQLEKVERHRLTPGESPFRTIEHMCRAQGVWQSGQADGSIKITKAGNGRNGAIIEGQNMLSGSADHNWSGRHSKVIVRGQRPYGHGKNSLEIEAIAQDAEVGRHRPVIVVQDDDTDDKRAKKRAGHRRDREAGNSLKASVEMQGFRDATGTLWTPGFLSFLQSPFLGIAQDMAIDAVTYSQERGKGSISAISLVDPSALGGKGRKGGKHNDAWDTDAGK